jgi:hypothetical protein
LVVVVVREDVLPKEAGTVTIAEGAKIVTLKFPSHRAAAGCWMVAAIAPPVNEPVDCWMALITRPCIDFLSNVSVSYV